MYNILFIQLYGVLEGNHNQLFEFRSDKIFKIVSLIVILFLLTIFLLNTKK